MSWRRLEAVDDACRRGKGRREKQLRNIRDDGEQRILSRLNGTPARMRIGPDGLSLLWRLREAWEHAVAVRGVYRWGCVLLRSVASPAVQWASGAVAALPRHPQAEWPEHRSAPDCWCGPRMISDGVWLHADGGWYEA